LNQPARITSTNLILRVYASHQARYIPSRGMGQKRDARTLFRGVAPWVTMPWGSTTILVIQKMVRQVQNTRKSASAIFAACRALVLVEVVRRDSRGTQAKRVHSSCQNQQFPFR
jgi:hypothetical protein